MRIEGFRGAVTAVIDSPPQPSEPRTVGDNRVRIWKRLGIVLAVLAAIGCAVASRSAWIAAKQYDAAWETQTPTISLAYSRCLATRPRNDDECNRLREALDSAKDRHDAHWFSYWMFLACVAIAPALVLGAFWTVGWIATGRWRTASALAAP
jgi:hypothetical protein